MRLFHIEKQFANWRHAMIDNASENVNSIFEQPWWLDIVAKDKWKEITVVEGDVIVGRFPIIMNNGSIELPVLTQTCGIWIKEEEKKVGNEHLSYEAKIINSLLEQLPKYKNFKVAIDSKRSYFLPFIWKGYKVVPRVSYRICDLSNLEDTYKNFSKTVKKNIKSAQKKVVVSREADIDVLWNIMNKTFEAQGRKYPVPKDILEKIVTESENRECGCMLTAIDQQGNVHACSYFVYDKNVFYYLISGADPKYRSSGAQSLILWEAIQYAAEVSQVFDFEGSMIEGIETFFRRFGGEPVVYYEIQKQPLLREILEILKPKVKLLLGYK